MKTVRGMKAPHLVPLSRQVVKVLKELREYTGGGETALSEPVQREPANIGYGPFERLAPPGIRQGRNDRARF
jgi:hypothetical protein